MRTVFANNFIHECAVEQILHDLLFLCVLGKCLNFVDEWIEEFVGVFLDGRVDRASIYIFEGFTELLGVVVLLLQVHEASKDALDLVENVLARRFIFLVFNFEYCFPKGRDHEQLLHNRVHVTNVANVLQANKPCR